MAQAQPRGYLGLFATAEEAALTAARYLANPEQREEEEVDEESRCPRSERCSKPRGHVGGCNKRRVVEDEAEEDESEAEEDESEDDAPELCGSRTERDGGFDGCILPFGHDGPHDLGVDSRTRHGRAVAPPSSFLAEDACQICYDACEVIDGVAAGRTSCGHLFHRGCLARWLQEAKVCGVCRSPCPSTLRMFAADEATSGDP